MSFKDFDILWKMVIQRRYEPFKRVFGGGEKVDNLAFRVGSGIGTACTSYPDPLTCEVGECFLQLSLDGRMPNL